MNMLNDEYIFTDDTERVAFVGDLHLSYKAPQSRNDDYPETILEKCRNLCKILSEKCVSKCIFLGDIFHKPTQPTPYVNKAIRVFSDLSKEYGIEFFTIIGNHDISYNDVETVWSSSLGTMFLSSVIKPFGRIQIGDIEIVGCHYGQELIKNQNKCKHSILVAHKFFENELFGDSLSRKDLSGLGYNDYILGHDHVPYDNVNTGKYRVIRCGSLSRGTSHYYNTHRGVYADIYDIKSNTFTRVSIPCKDPVDVFKNEAVNKADSVSMSEEQFLELVNKITFSKEKRESVYDVLDRLNLKQDLMDCIEKYLKDKGIYREVV